MPGLDGDNDEALLQELGVTHVDELDEEQQMIIAEERHKRLTQQQIEEEQLRLARSVRHDPNQIDLGAVAAAELAAQKRRKHKKHGQQHEYEDSEDEQYYYGGSDVNEEDDLEALLMATSTSESSAAVKGLQKEVVKPKKGQVQPLQDKTKFYELQREIEKAKAAQEIKRKFAAPSSVPPQSAQLRQPQKSKQPKPSRFDPEEDIDDFLSGIDSLKVTTSQQQQREARGEAARSATSQSGPSLFSGSSTTPLGMKDLQNTEAWLDNLIN